MDFYLLCLQLENLFHLLVFMSQGCCPAEATKIILWFCIWNKKDFNEEIHPFIWSRHGQGMAQQSTAKIQIGAKVMIVILPSTEKNSVPANENRPNDLKIIFHCNNIPNALIARHLISKSTLSICCGLLGFFAVFFVCFFLFCFVVWGLICFFS